MIMNKEYKKQKNWEIGAKIMNKIIKKILNLLKCSNSKFNSCKILVKIITKNYKDYKLN